jgi:hypothetical protein
MGNWIKQGELATTFKKNGSHGFSSKNFCCYECGMMHRLESNITTCLKKYGTINGGATKEAHEKIRKTTFERYGVSHTSQTTNFKQKYTEKVLSHFPERKQQIRQQTRETCLKKYGVPCIFVLPNFGDYLDRPKIQQKRYDTMKKNNSFKGRGIINQFRCSIDEQYIYEKLITRFENIIFEPFIKGYGKADFYIPELDLYVEYNGTFSHGKDGKNVYGRFNPGDQEHLAVLAKWKSRCDFSKSKNEDYYQTAIYVWTVSDPRKRQFAKENNLNWIEFFAIKEFDAWFDFYKK